MSTVPFPEFFEDPSAFSLRLGTNQRMFASPFGGSEQVIDLQNDRLYASVTVPNRTHADAARLEAFIASFRGMSNTIELYHLVRPEPEGTMRGAPTVVGQSAGNGTILINTTPGATLLAGDMIGIGGLLLQVRQDCLADGSGLMACFLANRLRKDLADAAPVLWNRPTAPFRLISQPVVQYVPGYAPEVSLDFAEAVV